MKRAWRRGSEASFLTTPQVGTYQYPGPLDPPNVLISGTLSWIPRYAKISESGAPTSSQLRTFDVFPVPT